MGNWVDCQPRCNPPFFREPLWSAGNAKANGSHGRVCLWMVAKFISHHLIETIAETIAFVGVYVGDTIESFLVEADVVTIRSMGPNSTDFWRWPHRQGNRSPFSGVQNRLFYFPVFRVWSICSNTKR